MRIQCISRPRVTWSLPTDGMLFSLWQATTQALQPMHEFRSIVMAHCGPVFVVALLPRRLDRLQRCLVLVRSCGLRRNSSTVASRTMSRPSVLQCSWVSASTWRCPAPCHREPGGEAGASRGAQRIGVEADTVADPAGRRSPVAERERDRAVGLPGNTRTAAVDRRARRASGVTRSPSPTPSASASVSSTAARRCPR